VFSSMPKEGSFGKLVVIDVNPRRSLEEGLEAPRSDGFI
jgi:hypothetical protein